MIQKEYDWYGEIPIEWELIKIRYITELRNEKVSEVKDEVYIGLENIESKYGNYLPSNEEEKKNIEGISNKFYKGDILFGKLRPYLAKCIEVEFEGVCSTELIVLNVDRGKILPQFLKQIMLSPKFIDLINSSTYGAKMPRASWEFIKNIEIPLPPIKLQRTMISILNNKLSNIDSLLAKKASLINLLKKQHQSIITESVTKGINSNVKMKDSSVEWIGTVPEHWKKSRIDFISKVKARLGWKGLKAEEYVEEGYAFLATPNLKFREIDFKSVNYITEERYLESPEIMLEVGDILLAKDGSTLGIVNVVRDLPFPTTVNSSIAVIRPTSKINSIYYYYYLKSTYIQNIINQIKDGMGVPHLFQADIKKFMILLPPLEEQEQITYYLDRETLKIENLINNVKLQIEKLKEYRQSLIYEAVTGKFDGKFDVCNIKLD